MGVFKGVCKARRMPESEEGLGDLRGAHEAANSAADDVIGGGGPGGVQHARAPVLGVAEQYRPSIHRADGPICPAPTHIWPLEGRLKPALHVSTPAGLRLSVARVVAHHVLMLRVGVEHQH